MDDLTLVSSEKIVLEVSVLIFFPWHRKIEKCHQFTTVCFVTTLPKKLQLGLIIAAIINFMIFFIWGTKKVVVLNRNHCIGIVLGGPNICRHRQVVLLQRWSFEQVWLYFCEIIYEYKDLSLQKTSHMWLPLTKTKFNCYGVRFEIACQNIICDQREIEYW